MQQIEPHFFAIVKSSEIACEMISLLPANDLVEEMKHLLGTQLDLLCHIIENKHYGSHSLQDFLDYADELRIQVLRIKGEW